MRWFDVEPCYVFHPLNAYDEGDAIVLDVIRYDKMFERDLHGPTEGHPALFRVDPKTVTRWAAAGRIGSIRTPGGHRRFREAEVHALLASLTTVAPQSSG